MRNLQEYGDEFCCCLKNGGFGKKAALTACSNGLSESRKPQVEKLAEMLSEMGIFPVISGCLYGKNDTAFSGTPRERAEALMRFYRDPEVKMIFDVSGGDMANEILPFLNFQEIQNSSKILWGYSDLTVLLNAVYVKTGKISVLYQVRNLTEPSGEWQRKAFESMAAAGTMDLFRFTARFIQKNYMEGVLTGGNIRCFLKLAGTEFWPDMHGKILLLEAMRGKMPQIASYLAHLDQMGVFHQVNGILLGTFLEMEESGNRSGIKELVLEYAGKDIPVAETGQIGHRTDSHGALIGSRISLKKEEGER